MLNRLPFLFFVLVLSLVFFYSCRNGAEDRPVIEEIDLEGRWEVNKAFRNGALTSTLEGAEFVFTPSLFSSNVPGFVFGEHSAGEYRLAGDTVYTGILRPSYFIVHEYRENELSLGTVIQGHSFLFELKRDGRNE